MKRVLVVAAHPDDEVLGCGGFMKILSRKGVIVQTVFMTDGESSRNKSNDKNERNIEISERVKSAHTAAELIGSNKPIFLNYPDNSLDTVPMLNVAKSIENIVSDFQPDTVLTHFASDLNVDHQLTSNAVLIATRPTTQCPVKTLLFFEIPSSTEWRLDGAVTPTFSPNYFVEIENVLDTKENLVNIYQQEMRDWPHPRSWKAINAGLIYNGSAIGLKYAERFMIGRMYYT